MADFFSNMDPWQARDLQLLSRLAYDVREARAGLLRYHDVSDEVELLGHIRRGEIPEHPTYENYLVSRILEQTRQAARAQMAGKQPPAVLHLSLRDRIEERFPATSGVNVSLTQDAILVALPNAVKLRAHVATSTEYAFVWQCDDDEATIQRIDTAPLHPGMAVHRHSIDGSVVADTLTHPAADSADKLCTLISWLLSLDSRRKP